MSTVTARFYVAETTRNAAGGGKVTLNAVTRKTPDNVEWSKYTPSGRIEMSVYPDLPAFAFFEEAMAAGADLALTFELIPKDEPAE